MSSSVWFMYLNTQNWCLIEQIIQILPVSCFIIRFPTSRVKCAVPFKTISIIVLNALAESLSVGDIKFPAALLITTLGRPTYRMHPRIRLHRWTIVGALGFCGNNLVSILFEYPTLSTHASTAEVTAIASLISHWIGMTSLPVIPVISNLKDLKD